jgi:hypothetical protein
MTNITDPMEVIIAAALDTRGVRYIHESEGKEKTDGLDFYLPEFGTYIELKRLYAPRIVTQMERVNNVIVIQGMEAALAFESLLAAQR